MEESAKPCPGCQSPYPYFDGTLWVCPECSHEWSEYEEENKKSNEIKDVNGNVLNDGDTVSVIKDLKVKGSSQSIKVGTKVKNIKLILDSSDGHDIACKIEGFGAINLKSQFVKKA